MDTDFPPLDSNEPIHKFGFSTLALVEKFSSPGLASRQSLFVRMLVFRLPPETETRVLLDSPQVFTNENQSVLFVGAPSAVVGDEWLTSRLLSPRRNAAHGFSLIPVDSLKITMKEILQKALKKRKGSQKGSGNGRKAATVLVVTALFVSEGEGWVRTMSAMTRTICFPCSGPLYRLEKQTEPNVPVDLDSTLETQSTLEFCLVRENSESRC